MWSYILLAAPTMSVAWTVLPHVSSRPGFRLREPLPRLSMSAVNEDIGLNELHTLLLQAALTDNFDKASTYSDELLRRISGDNPPQTEEEIRSRRLRMSWPGLGTADWLTDRLFDLNYTFPTTIQINSLEAVNAILDIPEEMMSTTTLGERVELSKKDMGIVVSGTTGSGKTFAYLVPMLSTLSDSFFARQRIRVGDEERVIGDKATDLAARVMAATSPELRSPDGRIRRGGVATGAALSTLGKSGKDVKKPLVLVVVPTRVLGVQVASLVFGLVGGAMRKRKADYATAAKVSAHALEKERNMLVSHGDLMRFSTRAPKG